MRRRGTGPTATDVAEERAVQASRTSPADRDASLALGHGIDRQSLIRLQRTAGNRAVAGLLDSRNGRSDGGKSEAVFLQRNGYFARGESGRVEFGKLSVSIYGTTWHGMSTQLANPFRFELARPAPLAIIGTGKEIIALLQKNSRVGVVNDLQWDQGGLVDPNRTVYWRPPEVFKEGMKVLSPAAEATKSLALGAASLAPGGPTAFGDPAELLESTDIKQGGFFEPVKKKLREAKRGKQELKARHIIVLSPYEGPGFSQIGTGAAGVDLSHVLSRSLSHIPSWRSYTQRK